ncbi:hypothetical protein HanLR1_Chr05g0190411 [Helianthus annuus]|nr:hypothetical protein HanLR1_Chr05g0190411 [Helianthus annuus]
MEDSSKDQSSFSGSKGGGSAKLLRYPLRSGTKCKDDKPPVSVSSNGSASRRFDYGVSNCFCFTMLVFLFVCESVWIYVCFVAVDCHW